MKSEQQIFEPIPITKQTAKRFLLDHHFLLPPKTLTGDQILTHLLKRLGCIQFDTINVVGRNADLVLQSRVKDYRPEILERLLYDERQLIDGWDKVASIYDTQDWPYFERHRKRMGNHHHLRSQEASRAVPKILEKIRSNGPVSSLDFKDSSKTDWAWGPTSVTRAGLEILYAEGKIGIDHRVNTRRHFDLIANLVPQSTLETPDPNLTDEDYQDWHVLRRIGGLGIASIKSGEHWLGIYGARKVNQREKILKRLLHRGEISLVKIDEVEKQVFYIRTKDISRLEESTDKQATKGDAAFLAPLDNLLWNRNLVRDIFDFSYIWEVYKPKDKREYGYYVLPVLFGEDLIARTDLKFDRKSNTLNLINWWWEPEIIPNEEITTAIQRCMIDFMNYLGAQSFLINRENFHSKEDALLFKKLM